MEASNWKYLSEGGMHVIFQSTTNGRLLLRVSKELVAIHNCDCNELSNSSTTTSRIVPLSNDPVQKLICHALSPYADLPEPVQLDAQFRKDLLNQTHPNAKHKYAPIGFFLRNYRITNENQSHNVHEQCVSVEIKPKAGYWTISPLAAGTAKYRVTRFVLQQNLYKSGSLIKDWMKKDNNGSSSFRKSAYDPLDLFSDDFDKIQKAIQSLMECPQNNFKIWCGQKHQLVNDSSLHNPTDWKRIAKILNIVDIQDTNDERRVQSVVVQMISLVLKQEKFLSKLLSLQKLDVIDGDGAVLVYQRLVALQEGCQERAEQLIDCVEEDATSKIPFHDLFSASPIPPCQPSDTLTQFCDEIQAFSLLLQDAFPQTPSKEYIRERKSRVLALVNNFTIEQCRFLLQNWLLSLSVCDLSFFLIFARGDDFSEKFIDDNEWSHVQQIDQPGRLLHHGNRFCYELKIIDFDRKPARKLRSRQKKEELFNAATLSSRSPASF
jgi:inositol-pentakisphosphate 2-kinase